LLFEKFCSVWKCCFNIVFHCDRQFAKCQTVRETGQCMFGIRYCTGWQSILYPRPDSCRKFILLEMQCTFGMPHEYNGPHGNRFYDVFESFGTRRCFCIRVAVFPSGILDFGEKPRKIWMLPLRLRLHKLGFQLVHSFNVQIRFKCQCV